MTEFIRAGNLAIDRQGIPPALAADLQAEMEDYLPRSMRRSYQDGLLGVSDRDESLSGYLSAHPSSVLPAVMEQIGLVRPTEALRICYQSPLAAQRFHVDAITRLGEIDEIEIIHGADQGAFDYAPGARTYQEAEASFRTARLNAGDVLRQQVLKRGRKFRQFHRGRNRGTLPRVTVVLSQFIE